MPRNRSTRCSESTPNSVSAASAETVLPTTLLLPFWSCLRSDKENGIVPGSWASGAGLPISVFLTGFGYFLARKLSPEALTSNPSPLSQGSVLKSN